LEQVYTVVLCSEPEGEFTVKVPALPGCFSRGRTVLEALRNVQEATECYLESLVQHGESIPSEAGTVTISTENLTEALIYRVSVGVEETQVA
jgi:antitoxin HicB